jgi:very-short-patch-repair endonuclease
MTTSEHVRFPRRAQLGALGITPAALETLQRRGEMHRMLHDVYALQGPGTLTLEERCAAAQVYADGDLAFACHTGLALAGGTPWPGDLHAVCATDRRVRSTPGLVVHRVDLESISLVRRGGGLVVPPPLALVQAFQCLPRGDRAGYVLRQIQQGVVRASDAVRLVGPNCHGRRELLDLLHLADTGTHSMGELRLLLRALRAGGLPDPERQYHVDLPSGAVYLDGAYVRAKVGLEYDGREHHFTAAARQHDIARDAELAGQGWLLLHCTADQLAPGRARIFADQVRRAVESRGGF